MKKKKWLTKYPQGGEVKYNLPSDKDVLLKKAKDIQDNSKIESYVDKPIIDKIKNFISHPISSLQYGNNPSEYNYLDMIAGLPGVTANGVYNTVGNIFDKNTYPIVGKSLLNVGSNIVGNGNVYEGVNEEAINIATDALSALPIVRAATSTKKILNAKIHPDGGKYMYRGLNEEGVKDALSSKVFRSKQKPSPKYVGTTGLNLTKTFSEESPYFTPYFSTASDYGGKYIAKVPKNTANWTQRYKKSDWSQYADRAIPIDNGEILKKHWLLGYRPMKYPQGGSLFNKDSVYKYAPRIGERLNDDRSVSTHLMTSSDNLAYPTLFQNIKDSSWYELPPREAYYEAKKKGEIFRFKTDQEADSFARGAWKPKYPSGGYLNYQDSYKGFGVGPLLTQDNSYYRSIMPTTREDIDAEINKSTTFGDIGNAIGGISQGVNEAGSLLSRFSGTQNPPQTNQIMPDISGWGVGQKSDEQLNFENDQAMRKSGVYNNFYPQQDGRYNPEGLFNEGLRGQRINSNVDSLGNIGFGKNGGRVAHCEDGGIPVGYPEYIHPSNVFQPHVIPVPKVHFSDDTTAFDMGTNLNDLVQMNGGKVKDYKNGGTVRELYESLTGKDWKTAKKDGLTDGSYSSNIKLRKKLLADLESRRKEPELHQYVPNVVRTAPELNEYNPNNIMPPQDYNEVGNNVLPTFPYGGYLNYQRPFNSNSNRMGVMDLQNATANDFMHKKVGHDRQKYADSKVDWGFMDWAKEPVGAITGVASTLPIVGDIVNDAMGDSFLTRTGGYQLGQGAGRVAQGAGQVVGGAVTVNPMMIANGVGEIGGGVGSTIGNLEAESAMGGYDESGYVSGKRMAKSANDFRGRMSSTGGLYGNVAGGVDSLKNFGGLGGMMDNLRGGQKGLKGFGNAMFNMYGNGIQFEDGGKVTKKQDSQKWLDKY